MKKLTESDLARIVKRIANDKKVMEGLVSEEVPGVGKFDRGVYQGYKTQDYKATGSNLFKKGQFEIDPNNFNIVNLLDKVNQAVTKSAPGAITVTVNGGASNTSWGNNPAGSPEAIRKNKELAQKRIDSLIKFLKSKVTSPMVTYVPGSATVGNVKGTKSEEDQFVSISVNGKGADGKVLVDRDKTSIQYNTYNKNYKRVCVKIPAGLVEQYKVKIREFKKELGLDSVPFGIYDI